MMLQPLNNTSYAINQVILGAVEIVAKFAHGGVIYIGYSHSVISCGERIKT
jgi:hypothetical protein